MAERKNNFPRPIELANKQCKTVIEMEQQGQKIKGKEVYTRYRNALKGVLSTLNVTGVKIPEIGEVVIPEDLSNKLSGITKLIICEDKLLYIDKGQFKKVEFDKTVSKEKIILEDGGYRKVFKEVLRDFEKEYKAQRDTGTEDLTHTQAFEKLLLAYAGILEDKQIRNSLEQKKVIEIVNTTNAIMHNVTEVFYMESTFFEKLKVTTSSKNNALGFIQDVDMNFMDIGYSQLVDEALQNYGNKELMSELKKAERVAKERKLNVYNIKYIQDGRILTEYDEKDGTLYKFLMEKGTEIEEIYIGNENLDSEVESEEFEIDTEEETEEFEVDMDLENFKKDFIELYNHIMDKWVKLTEKQETINRINEKVSSYEDSLWGRELKRSKDLVNEEYRRRYLDNEAVDTIDKIAPKLLIEIFTLLYPESQAQIETVVQELGLLMEYLPKDIFDMRLKYGEENEKSIDIKTSKGKKLAIKQLYIIEKNIDRYVGCFNGIIHYIWVRYCTRSKNASIEIQPESTINKVYEKIDTFIYTENILQISNRYLEKAIKSGNAMFDTLPKTWSKQVFEDLMNNIGIPVEKHLETEESEKEHTRQLLSEQISVILEQLETRVDRFNQIAKSKAW